MYNPWARVVQHISSRLAFFPPVSTYEVKSHRDATGELYIHPKTTDIPKVLNCQVRVIKTKKHKGGSGDQEIVVAFVPYKNRTGQQARITILYSHGNAVDLGQMLPFYKDLSRALKVNIMGYDYSGYGCSTGTATVNNTMADIEAVYECLLEEHNAAPNDIIVYGQSVGSGPTAWLGSRIPGLAGVVLHTPLLSGIRVLNPSLKWWPTWADVYPNHLLVPKIQAPVLVLHGTDDEVIHFSHGQRLHDLAKKPVAPLWAAGYNHQNLELCPQYIPRLKQFIEEVSGEYQSPATAGNSAPTTATNSRVNLEVT